MRVAAEIHADKRKESVTLDDFRVKFSEPGEVAKKIDPRIQEKIAKSIWAMRVTGKPLMPKPVNDKEPSNASGNGT